MTRQCGTCTLCCKLPHVTEINKPTNTWCQHCLIGDGCGIYADRPAECKAFSCLWLDGVLSEELKPDKVSCVAAKIGGCVWVMVDPDKPRMFWSVVQELSETDHVLVTIGDTLKFVCGKGKPRPQKIVLDWTL